MDISTLINDVLNFRLLDNVLNPNVSPLEQYYSYKILENRKKTSIIPNSSVDIFDDLENITPPPPAIPLFLGKAFYKSRANLLYSDGKVGKSLLSIEIAKHNEIKNPFFILMEDYNAQQAYRYKQSLGDKVRIMTRKKWDELYQETEETNRIQKNLTQALCKKLGFNDKEASNTLIVLKNIMKYAIIQGIDFICIDSLDALLPNIDTLQREVIEEILKIYMEDSISQQDFTLLLIHHENKQGKAAGTRHLKNAVDHIYHLTSDNKDNNLLCLDGESRYGESIQFWFRRIAIDDYSARYELSQDHKDGYSDSTDITDNKSKNIKEIMITIIQNNGNSEIAYEDFFNKVTQEKECTKETFNNNLTKLKDETYITMKNGSDWKSGIIINQNRLHHHRYT